MKTRKSMYDVEKDDFTLSKEMDDSLSAAMNSAWNEIAADCFESADETMEREDVLEVILDANRLQDHTTMDVAAYAIWMSNFQPDAWSKFVRSVFPSNCYGY